MEFGDAGAVCRLRPLMESFFTRFKNAFVLIAILLAQTIALAIQVHRPADPANPDSAQVRLLRLWTLSIFSPLERLGTGGGSAIRHAWNSYIDLRHVRQQEQDLRREIATLRLQRAALAEDALEGQRLQSLLRFSRNYVSKTVAAHVIGTSGSDQSRILILDKGSRDGLKPDMPVITPDGIVGKLRDVFPSTSQLLLLSDPTAGAGVILKSTRIRAIIHGDALGRVQITNLTPDDRIKPGETVLTSGGDQVFPRGLPVGTIQSIAPDPEHQPYSAITLRTAANLNQLEEVLVIVGTSSALDPEAQQQLTAEAAQHASEMSAQRLPSIRPDAAELDPTKPADPSLPPGAASLQPPADNAKDLVPKPKPVLHPDRYSPGAAPPATDLTPGAPAPPPQP